MTTRLSLMVLVFITCFDGVAQADELETWKNAGVQFCHRGDEPNMSEWCGHACRWSLYDFDRTKFEPLSTIDRQRVDNEWCDARWVEFLDSCDPNKMSVLAEDIMLADAENNGQVLLFVAGRIGWGQEETLGYEFGGYLPPNLEEAIYLTYGHLMDQYAAWGVGNLSVQHRARLQWLAGVLDGERGITEMTQILYRFHQFDYEPY